MAQAEFGLVEYEAPGSQIPVRADLVSYNYITYERLGSNLDRGFLSFLASVLGGSSNDFFYIDSESAENLRALFHADRDSDIPSTFRRLISSLADNWIYFYSEESNGRPEELIQVEYSSEMTWNATVFQWPPEGDIQQVNQYSGDGELFYLSRSRLSHTKAISFPYRISIENALDLLLGGRSSARGLSSLREFCTLQIIQTSDRSAGADAQFVIFNPAKIISHSARVISYYKRFIEIVNPRVIVPEDLVAMN